MIFPRRRNQRGDREKDVARLREEGTGHVLDDAGYTGLAALCLLEVDLDREELVCARRGLVVGVQVRGYADPLERFRST